MQDSSTDPTTNPNTTSGRPRRLWAIGGGVLAAAGLTFAVGVLIAGAAADEAEPLPDVDGSVPGVVQEVPDSVPGVVQEVPDSVPDIDSAAPPATDRPVDTDGPVIHEVTGLGTPLSLSLDAGWVQSRDDPGEAIFTHLDQSPDGYNRRVIFLRPHGLTDPTRPQVFGPAWPLDDIEGWLDNIVDGIVVTDPQQVQIGGRDSLYFETEITDPAAVCGTASFCAGFIANTHTPGPEFGGEGVVSGWAFNREFHDRIWWIDQGTEAPLVIIAQTASTDRPFQPTADALLDTLTIGDPRPHPIPFDQSGLPEPVPACPPAVPNEFPQPAGTVASFDRTGFEVSEGVAVDKSGNVYVSLAPLGQIVRFAPGSSDYEVFAEVPDWDLRSEDYFVDHFGILGLALDADGNVYAAVDSPDRAGVWKFDCRTGAATRFAGTEDMLFANALAFDDRGNLFVTESFSGMEGDVPLGAIWKITPDGEAGKWLENTTLGGPNRFGLPKPNGANGIAFRDGLLYVNVLQQTSIVTIPVLDDGSPGEVAPYAVTENAFINDGLALDTDGGVYVTDVITNGIVRVDPDGTVVPIAGGTDMGFDSPSNLAFGVGATESTMYVVNLANGSFEPSDMPGPGLIAIDVDTPGMPLP